MQYLVSSSRLLLVVTLVFLFSIATLTLYFSSQRFKTVYKSVPEIGTRCAAYWTGSNCEMGYPGLGATDAELRNITRQIWEADRNRLSDNDVQYNISGPIFFTFVNETALTGTYKKMIALFKNYQPLLGQNDSCNQTCLDEQNDFLDAILQTEPIRRAHDWLVAKGLASDTEFKDELRQYWFLQYNRTRTALDSSGFEHTFVGEIDTRRKKWIVTGFHNWVQLYFEEKARRLNYTGPIESCPPSIEQIIFQWKPIISPEFYNKTFSTLFIRSSPEVEIALATVCLLTRPRDNCTILLENYNRTMITWNMTNLPTTIASTYPNC